MSGIIRGKNGKIYVPPEEAERAKSIGLLQYFRMTCPSELRRVGQDYCTKSHDSLKMSENGKWNWYSQGKGGSNAVSYLMDIEGMTFQEAVIEVLQATPKDLRAFKNTAKDKSKEFILPLKDDNNDILFDYLYDKRAISSEVINYFIRAGDLYQERKYKSVCFIGRDINGVARLANLRGTRSDFKSTTTGSDRRYGFSHFTEAKNGLHLFEAPIDMLSYATLIHSSGLDISRFNMLSLSGIYAAAQNLEESKKPVCLEQALIDHPYIDKLYIHFDNDGAGISASKALETIYKDIEVHIEPPPKGFKDINDYIVKRDIRKKNPYLAIEEHLQQDRGR